MRDNLRDVRALEAIYEEFVAIQFQAAGMSAAERYRLKKVAEAGVAKILQRAAGE